MASISVHLVILHQTIISILFASSGILTSHWRSGDKVIKNGTSLPWDKILSGTNAERAQCAAAIISPLSLILLLIINGLQMSGYRKRNITADELDQLSLTSEPSKRCPPLLFTGSFLAFCAMMSSASLLFLNYFTSNALGSLGYSFWFCVIHSITSLELFLILTFTLLFS